MCMCMCERGSDCKRMTVKSMVKWGCWTDSESAFMEDCAVAECNGALLHQLHCVQWILSSFSLPFVV